MPDLAKTMGINNDSRQWRDGVKRLVSDHLTRSDLDVNQAADMSNISRRTLYRVLAGERDLTLHEAYRLGIVKPLKNE